MGLENTPESRLHCNTRSETLEIASQEPENCDNESCSEEYLVKNVKSQQICDITIDVKKLLILDLSHCNLTNLPVECKKLNLNHLGLSHNKLKEVPICLYSGLKFLKSLDLSYNEIEKFEMEPECLPYIQILKLNNNRFQNVPKWFLMFKCTNLEEFNYSNNKAKHYKYSKNSINLQIMKLKKLELANSYLIDEDYNFLKVFKYLKYLDISNEGSSLLNKFKEIDDLFVKPKWKELHVLKLNSLSISLFPEGICWIYSLKELHMAKNNLSWLPDNIEYLTNLEVLDVSSNFIVSIPRTILSLEKLKTLLASNNSIGVIPDLSQMSSLEILDLYGNFLDEIHFPITDFELVDFEGNYFETENMENYSEYEVKRDRLRVQYDERKFDGPRMVPHVPESPPYDPELEEGMYDEELTEYVNVFPCNVDEEDWDQPVKAKRQNSDIDSIDEEWRGEEDGKCIRMVEKGKIYVSEDDWMFTDFEES